MVIHENYIKEKECIGSSIPVMGWNYINVTNENQLLKTYKQRYYFVHSYYFPLNTPGKISNADIGFKYCAAFQKENIFGVQFHPEKSHNFGKKIFTNFCSLR